jgi:hypothetical protein
MEKASENGDMKTDGEESMDETWILKYRLAVWLLKIWALPFTSSCPDREESMVLKIKSLLEECLSRFSYEYYKRSRGSWWVP